MKLDSDSGACGGLLCQLPVVGSQVVRVPVPVPVLSTSKN